MDTRNSRTLVPWSDLAHPLDLGETFRPVSACMHAYVRMFTINVKVKVNAEVNSVAPPVSPPTGLLSLPDDLIRRILGAMCMETRLCLCGVAAPLRALVTPCITRRFLMARVQGQTTRIASRPARPRRLLGHDHPPSLSLHLPQSKTVAEGMLLVDLDYRSPPDTCQIAAEFAAVGARIPCLHVLSVVSYQTRLCDVLQSLTPAMRLSVHTLRLARQYSDFSPPQPLDIGGLPMLRSVKLIRVSVDLQRLGVLSPHLTSLHISEDHGSVTGWLHLSAFTALRDLSVSSRSVLGLFCSDALDGIAAVPRLDSLALMGVGNASAMYAAATSVTGLSSLSLRLSLAQRLSGMWEVVECQDAIERIAANNPDLRQLDLEANRNVHVSAQWTALTSVAVLHTTCVPPMPSITRMLVRWATTFSFRQGYNVLPPNLERLETSYGALACALPCRGLRELAWTPHSQGGFPGSEQLALLAVVAREGSWPDLHTLLILPDRRRGAWVMNDSPGEARRHCRHSAQMLAQLASRPTCVIEHVTLFQRSAHQFGAVEALCRMPVLARVTLVKMRVTAVQLRRLVRMPSMRLIELVGVTQVSRRQFEAVRAEAAQGGGIRGAGVPVRLLWRSMEVVFADGDVLEVDDERD